MKVKIYFTNGSIRVLSTSDLTKSNPWDKEDDFGNSFSAVQRNTIACSFYINIDEILQNDNPKPLLMFIDFFDTTTDENKYVIQKDIMKTTYIEDEYFASCYCNGRSICLVHQDELNEVNKIFVDNDEVVRRVDGKLWNWQKFTSIKESYLSDGTFNGELGNLRQLVDICTDSIKQTNKEISFEELKKQVSNLLGVPMSTIDNLSNYDTIKEKRETNEQEKEKQDNPKSNHQPGVELDKEHENVPEHDQEPEEEDLGMKGCPKF